ncbi:MAG TPA: NAD(+)/NADH kinase [Candidatus Eisenbacteria bacterium]|nr:NAD(+)/NADH kinase [Candidatus Eisenbacteria bacterium]
MKKIAIYPNKSRDPNFEVTQYLVERIVAHGGKAIMETNLSEGYNSDLIEFDSFSNCDLLICLGGDGTFLSAAHNDSSKALPQIGVNLGSVGFLTGIRPKNINKAVLDLLNDDFQIEERMMLDIKIFDDQHKIIHQGKALNDIVLARGWGNTGIITMDLSIDNNSVEQIPGDGVIVSTPTGSTAYNLAAGGPIVHPEVHVILITPLAPHTLHNRTYISGKDSEVKLQLKNQSSTALFSIDGRQNINVKENYYALISGSQDKFKKIRLYGDQFYQTLPNKIRLRGMAK